MKKKRVFSEQHLKHIQDSYTSERCEKISLRMLGNKNCVGIKHSEKTKRKMSLAQMGKKNHNFGKHPSQETLRKMSLANKGRLSPRKGKHLSEEHRRKLSASRKSNPVRYWLGKKMPLAVRQKMGLSHSGSMNPSWKGGTSFLPYGPGFTRHLKDEIRKRDRYRCQECFRHQDELFTKSGKKVKLDIHHIDFDKNNSNPNNLISLCHSCHAQTQFNQDAWIEYFKNMSGC